MLKKILGKLAMAVPGEMKGYWELHKQYGKLPWSELFTPSIKLCEEGHIISDYLERALIISKDNILQYQDLADIYVNPGTGDVWKKGERIKLPKLGQTLRVIADEGGDVFYNGSIADLLISDIEEFGGIITHEDLNSYAVKWDSPVEMTLLNTYKLYSTPLPSSGSILVYMLNILQDILDSDISVKNYHRIAEAFKHAYAKRTRLGDMDFEESVISVRNDINCEYKRNISYISILNSC